VSEHTPGPLRVARAPHPESGLTKAEYLAGLERGGPQLFVVIAPDPEGKPEDYLVTAVTGDGPASEANARLYAAAPEMAALLLSAYQHVSHGGPKRGADADELRKAGLIP